MISKLEDNLWDIDIKKVGLSHSHQKACSAAEQKQRAEINEGAWRLEAIIEVQCEESRVWLPVGLAILSPLPL